MPGNLLENLNSPQRNAVEHLNGPLLILAGAGSGKTRVLTYKIAYLLEQGIVRPWEVLAVTFTNKAAGEMKHRVEELIKFPVDGMWIGTFHSICARILRVEGDQLGYTSNFTIYDADDQIRLIGQLMDAMNIDSQKLKPRQVQYKISANKNKVRGPKAFEQSAVDFTDRKAAEIYWEYEAALRRNNAFDFDDLIIKPLDIFTQKSDILEKYQSKFKYILVDEYQDTNKAQYYFIKQLSAAHRNICVVGDEDQSIYRWRGADIQNILSFEKDYPECEVVRLEQNYRSTQTILDSANAVVANNLKRLGKNLWSQKDAGEKVRVIGNYDAEQEAQQAAGIIRNEISQNDLSYKDIAILYRTNAQSRVLEDKLRRANIPYIIVGGTKFYDRKEVKDILAYLRILVNTRDAVALRRIINYPTRGIGMTSQKRLEAFARENELSLYDAILDVERIDTISGAVVGKIRGFVNSIEEIRKTISDLNALEIATEVVDRFGLKSAYEYSQTPDDQTRLENVNELLNSIASFTETNQQSDASLGKYLEEVALFTDIDRWDPNHSAVTLMTLHSAKGLEFPAVIIAGLENGLFPLARSFDNTEDLEEERRLFYVGMTRAKENLYLLWARQRRRFSGNSSGMSFRSMPSQFLKEIPANYKSDETVFNELEHGYRRKSDYKMRTKEKQSNAGTYAASMLNNDKYKIGDWVVHEEHGKGQILGIENSSAGTKLSVFFRNRGLKKIIAELANLKNVE